MPINQILIVDDEPEIRQLIRMHLERDGLQVIEANSGRQAIQYLQEYTIELVILDLMMDDGNGLQQLIQSDEALQTNTSLQELIAASQNLTDSTEQLNAGQHQLIPQAEN